MMRRDCLRPSLRRERSTKLTPGLRSKVAKVEGRPNVAQTEGSSSKSAPTSIATEPRKRSTSNGSLNRSSGKFSSINRLNQFDGYVFRPLKESNSQVWYICRRHKKRKPPLGDVLVSCVNIIYLQANMIIAVPQL